MYEDAASACEQYVHLTDERSRAKLIGCLIFKRRHGGRVLRIDLPSLGLRKLDRLEPCDDLWGIYVNWKP